MEVLGVVGFAPLPPDDAERLIVDGLALVPAQARTLRAGIESHLGRLLADSPLHGISSYAIAARTAPSVAWNEAADAGIAQSLHTALTVGAPSKRNAR